MTTQEYDGMWHPVPPSDNTPWRVEHSTDCSGFYLDCNDEKTAHRVAEFLNNENVTPSYFLE